MPPLPLDEPPPVMPPEGEEVPEVPVLKPPAMPEELAPLEPAWLLEELELLLLLMPPLLDPPLALAPP
jgi:hypothetical protein